jgi:hypothetical protein
MTESLKDKLIRLGFPEHDISFKESQDHENHFGTRAIYLCEYGYIVNEEIRKKNNESREIFTIQFHSDDGFSLYNTNGKLKELNSDSDFLTVKNFIEFLRK